MNLPTFFGLLTALAGAWFLSVAITDYRRARASVDWPGVEGLIIKSTLWGKRNIDGEMRAANHFQAGYRYQVGGKDFEGHTVAFFTLVYPETVEWAERFPEGQAATIRVSPDDPAVSVLVP